MNTLQMLSLPLLGFGSFLSETWTALRGESPHSEVPPLERSFVPIIEAVLAVSRYARTAPEPELDIALPGES